MILAGFRYKFFQLGKRPQRIVSISGLTPHRLRALRSEVHFSTEDPLELLF